MYRWEGALTALWSTMWRMQLSRKHGSTQEHGIITEEKAYDLFTGKDAHFNIQSMVLTGLC